ncbi:MAG: hypothetical protein SGPRY_014264, partial [Prymnesium sp.]
KRVEVKRAIPQERIAAEDAASAGEAAGYMGQSSHFPGRRGGSAPHNSNSNGMYHPNAYMGAAGGVGMMAAMGAAVAGPGPHGKAGMPPMNGFAAGPAGGMFAGMVGVPNALNPSSWSMSIMPNIMNGGAPNPPSRQRSSSNRASINGKSSNKLPPRSNAPSLSSMGSSAPTVETNVALNAALSTANSVLSNAAALAEPPLEGASDSVALDPNVRNAFANPKNNYGSASAALSAGLRAGYGLDELPSSSGSKDGDDSPDSPKPGPLPVPQDASASLGNQLGEAGAGSGGQTATSAPQAAQLAQTAAQQASQAQVQQQLAGIQAQQAQLNDANSGAVPTAEQLQQQLQALQQHQQFLQHLQQERIRLQIKQQQQLQMHLNLQQQSGSTEAAGGAKEESAQAQAEDMSTQMVHMAISDGNKPMSSGASPELQPLPGFSMQGYSQIPRPQ